MVSIETTTETHGGITLVTVRLTGDGVARRVRVRHRLDGPVWPPRSRGVPAPGWDERGYEGIVPADGRLALGYATPAPPDGSPVSLEEGDVVRDADESIDPADVFRRLGDPAPPRGAVPLPTAAAESVPANPDQSDEHDEVPSPAEPNDTGAADSHDTGDPTGPDMEPGPARSDGSTASPRDDHAGGDTTADPVVAWLDRVEARVTTVERLDAADSVSDLTAALSATGGLEASERAVRATAADRRRLLAVADRARHLADRIESTDPDLRAAERVR